MSGGALSPWRRACEPRAAAAEAGGLCPPEQRGLGRGDTQCSLGWWVLRGPRPACVVGGGLPAGAPRGLSALTCTCQAALTAEESEPAYLPGVHEAVSVPRSDFRRPTAGGQATEGGGRGQGGGRPSVVVELGGCEACVQGVKVQEGRCACDGIGQRSAISRTPVGDHWFR